jgi:DNA-binding Lrp family transcriptional regulator
LRDAFRERRSLVVTAYVLIQAEVGRASSIARQAVGIAGVITAEAITGPYDVIIRIETGSIDDLGRMVVGHIQALPGITRTVTCPVVHI